MNPLGTCRVQYRHLPFSSAKHVVLRHRLAEDYPGVCGAEAWIHGSSSSSLTSRPLASEKRRWRCSRSLPPFAMRGAGADEGQIRLFEPTPSNCFPRERAVSACASPDGGLRCGIVGGGDPQTAKRRAEPRGALARSWQSRLCWGQRAEAACGDRGGPGYRGPDGRCVGWEAPGSRLRLLVHCSNLNGNHPPCSGLGA